MAQALIEAQKAADHEEVPIGAVIVKDGEIIARSYNARELHQKATHHAEICAIDMANDFVGNWRLLDCALFVTIEPCVMCSGAISLARLPQVYFGATNPKFGGAVSLYQILEDKRLNHRLHVESGILEEECAQMMQNFFKNRRKK
ncbi:tRNA adenosine(34) deaminase TadA [Lactococcus laudensis]